MKITRHLVAKTRLSASARCFARFILLSLGFALAAPLHAKPLKVFVLAGQSNMQGHAKFSTFEHIGMDPVTKPMLAKMLGADGKPKVCERVWISSIGCGKDEAASAKASRRRWRNSTRQNDCAPKRRDERRERWGAEILSPKLPSRTVQEQLIYCP